MTNTLVASYELDPFPGSPFSDELVDIAVASVRAEARWHIAPVVAETVALDSYGGTMLNLPTRRVVSITSVTDAAGRVYAATDYTRVGAALHRSYGWPIGPVTINWSHGYAETPLELLPVIAGRARPATLRDPALASVTVGPRSESYRTDGAGYGMDPALARYSLLPAGVA